MGQHDPENGYGSYNCMVVKRQGGDLELRKSDQLHPIRVGRQLVPVSTL
jgi:hypothetical protein